MDSDGRESSPGNLMPQMPRPSLRHASKLLSSPSASLNRKRSVSFEAPFSPSPSSAKTKRKAVGNHVTDGLIGSEAKNKLEKIRPFYFFEPSVTTIHDSSNDQTSLGKDSPTAPQGSSPGAVIEVSHGPPMFEFFLAPRAPRPRYQRFVKAVLLHPSSPSRTVWLQPSFNGAPWRL